ncbi:MAG TPA: maleylacetoacetate isomerase [Sandaracinaceae bacterium]
MKLYGYWRSSATYRVRIALAYKGVPHEIVPVHLLEGGGQQHTEAYRAKNPMAQVPALELDDGTVLAQSMAILEYLEERYPEPPLLPKNPVQRARARQLAEIVNSGIQPLQNLDVTKRLEAAGVDAKAWSVGVIRRGLAAYEAIAARTAGEFSVGDAPTIADCALVPQLYNARRFGIDVAAEHPTLARIEARCAELEAFARAHPDRQPDAPREGS